MKSILFKLTFVAVLCALAALPLFSCDENPTDIPADNPETETTVEQPEPEPVPEEIPQQPADEPAPTVYNIEDCVYEYDRIKVSMTDMFDMPFESNFSIPHLAFETPAAVNINQKILKNYPEVAFGIVEMEPVRSDIDYEYSYICDVTENGIVAVMLKLDGGFMYSEGFSNCASYYYSIPEEKAVTVEEYLDAIGVDTNTLYKNIVTLAYMYKAYGGESSLEYMYIPPREQFPVIRNSGENTLKVFVDYQHYCGADFYDIAAEEYVYGTARTAIDTCLYADFTEYLRYFDVPAVTYVPAGASLEVIPELEMEYASTSNECTLVRYGNFYGYVSNSDIER